MQILKRILYFAYSTSPTIFGYTHGHPHAGALERIYMVIHKSVKTFQKFTTNTLLNGSW